MAAFYNSSSKNVTLISGSNENASNPSMRIKSSIIQGNWYYFYFSVDYTNKLSYLYFYDPNTTTSNSATTVFSTINPSFSSTLNLIFGIDPFHNPNNYCGIAGNLSSIFYVNNYAGNPSLFLYRNGLTTNIMIDFSFSENVGQVIFNKIDGGINGTLGNGISIETQDPLWDQLSYGIKINKSNHHITIPYFSFLDLSTQSFGIYLAITLNQIHCSKGYLFQRVQANLQTRFGIFYENSTKKIGITLNGAFFSSNIDLSNGAISISCTQFKRPNMTCFIFNSTAFEQITTSSLFSDVITDTTFLGGYNCSNSGYFRKFIFFRGSTAFTNNNWQCISNCNIGLSLFNSSCLNYQILPVCDTSSFSNSAGCLTCDYRCKECLDYSNKFCSSCNSNFDLLFNQTCSCKPGSYLAVDPNGFGVCQPCELNCTECSGGGANCTKCDNTTFLLNGKCFGECPDGYYTNLSLGKCISCNISNCKNCTLDLNNCSTCVNNSYLLWGFCYSRCPIGYGNDPLSGRCLPCANNLCANCSFDFTNCSDCTINSFLHWGSCNTSCPSFYGANSTTKRCVKCVDQYCLECNGRGMNCTSCNPNTFLFNAQCYNPCPIKYTGNVASATCIPCNDSRCENCSSNTLECYKCDNNSFILNGTCYSNCPRKFYGNSSNKNCLNCNETCAYCSGPAHNDCTSCEIGYFSLNLSSKTQCVTSCPEKFSANVSSYSCVACQDSNCLQCSNDGKNCSLCNSSSYLLWGRCFSTCPLSFGKNDSSGTCSPCTSNFCNNCSSDPQNCTTCLTNYFLLWGNCSTSCPDYFGTNTTLRACIRCTDINCTVCNGRPTNCTKCNSMTFLLNFTCYYNCPITYTNNATLGTCLKCKDPNCNYCSSDTQICYACNNQTYFINGSCYSSCPGNYWANTSDLSCRPCDSTCQNCTGPSSTNCTSCTPGALRWLYLNQCLPTCPGIGFYPNNITYTCSNCHSTCNSCTDNLTLSCTSCLAPRFLLNSGCITNCPEKYYPNTTVRECQPCRDQNCQWCNSTYTDCDKCLTSTRMNLLYSSCIPQCPNGFYTENSTQRCIPCDSTCFGCSGPADTNCTSCNGTKYFFNYTNECLENCPGGYYSNVTDNKCYPCIRNCLRCGDNTNLNCTLCNNMLNYFQDLYRGCWFARCGDGRKLGPLEECDDGNNMNGDGCDRTCKIERGWYCSEPDNHTLLSVCNTKCGDSIFVSKTEACDDGNFITGDGCDTTCLVETGYFCYDGSLYSKSICTCEPINSTITFSFNWESLIIAYPKELTVPSLLIGSALCDHLFESSTILLLGLGHSCSVNQNKIEINLGLNHKMNLNQNIKIIPSSFTATSCPQNPKSIELTLNDPIPGNYNHRPSFAIESENHYQLCSSNSLRILNVTNVGKREYSISWDITMSNPIDVNILNNAKSNLLKFANSLESTLDPLILLSKNSYTLTASITPFWGSKGEVSKILVPSVRIEVRDPDPEYICKDPSRIDFQTVASQRNVIILKFDRPIANSSSEILNNLEFRIIPDYSDANFEPLLNKIDEYTFNLTLIYKKTIFKKQLAITLKDPSKLRDVYGNSYVGSDKHTINLLNFDVYSTSQLKFSQQASNSAAAGLVAAIIPIIVFASGPLILSFLNGAQVVNYLRFVNFYYPVNVEAFLRSFNNINFNFLPSIFSIFNIKFPIIDQESPFRFESLKISSLFLENAGGVLFMFVATYIGHQFLNILIKLPIPIRQVKKFFVQVNRFMVYNGYLLVMDSTYYQQSLSLFLQLSHLSTENYWNIFSIFMCLTALIIYLGYFIFLYKMASKGDAIYYTKHSALMKKLGVLFADYDLRKKKARGFTIVICIRKMIHCIILIYLHDYIWTEILLLVLMNISYLLLLGIIRPYFSMGRLKREIFIEFCYLMCHIFVGLMKFYESDSDMKFNFGWGVVAGSMGIISVYLLDGIQMAINKTKDLLKKIRNKLYQRFKKKNTKISPYVYQYEPSSPPKKENSKILRLQKKNNLKRQMTPFWS